MMIVRMKIQLRLLTFLLVESIEHEPIPASQLPGWVHSTQEAIGDLVGDHIDQWRTRS
jgi:hypothetical protein